MTLISTLKQVSLAITGATLAVLGGGEVAGAFSFSFDLGGSPALDSSFSYNAGDVGLTVTGFRDTLGGGTTSAFVVKSPDGLGVTSLASDISDLQFLQLDGLGLDEGLQFEFDQKITINSATFSRVGSNDDFTVSVDAGGLFLSEDIPGGNFFDTGVGTFDFTALDAGLRTGTLVSFSVAGSNDDYILKSIEVEAVPEPLTILGTGMALGFGGLFKKELDKKKKTKV
ncbi:MAG: PEP-CTERM sorting domain-containing protein [Microcoleaceae cyanobacterium]